MWYGMDQDNVGQEIGEWFQGVMGAGTRKSCSLV